MDYVPLIDLSPQNGEAAVLFAALRGAGFDVEVECDIRGWMYWYKPFMSLAQPVTIWIPQSQLGDARAYMDAPFAELQADVTAPAGFWAFVRSSRRAVFAAAVFVMAVVGY